MHDFLKNLAEENDWSFEYARQDYLNLYDDVEAGKIYLMVEPITTDSAFSDLGNETVTFSGKLWIVMSSDVDEEYKDKYEQYIEPIFSNIRKTITNTFACSDYELKLFRTTEVINFLDENLDGLLVNYSATYVD